MPGLRDLGAQRLLWGVRGRGWEGGDRGRRAEGGEVMYFVGKTYVCDLEECQRSGHGLNLSREEM